LAKWPIAAGKSARKRPINATNTSKNAKIDSKISSGENLSASGSFLWVLNTIPNSLTTPTPRPGIAASIGPDARFALGPSNMRFKKITKFFHKEILKN
jgi:hypothetical protein